MCFGAIRFFENEIFFDPLLEFYKGNFNLKAFPELDVLKYSANLIFRYILNTAVSLVLIWIIFSSKNFIKFSLLLYSLLLFLGILVFWILTYNIQPEDYMALFYVRRFLIQPLFIIILIPAFYFQKINKNAN